MAANSVDWHEWHVLITPQCEGGHVPVNNQTWPIEIWGGREAGRNAERTTVLHAQGPQCLLAISCSVEPWVIHFEAGLCSEWFITVLWDRSKNARFVQVSPRCSLTFLLLILLTKTKLNTTPLPWWLGKARGWKNSPSGATQNSVII